MIDKDFLVREYVEKDRTAKDIGQEVGLSDTQVRYWLKKHGISLHPRGGRSKSVDLTNQLFGELIVISQAKGDGHCAIWNCRCSCGTVKTVKGPYLRNGDIRSCGKCLEHYAWKGHGDISGLYWARVKIGARRRNIEFDLTIEECWEKFLHQNRRCALSGVELFFVRNHTSESKVQTASLDRIDSKLGYTSANIQWVHKKVNVIKWHLSEKDFFGWCKRIYEHNNLSTQDYE